MNCERAQLWIQGLVDRELSGWREWRLRRHLAHCDACLRTLAESSAAHQKLVAVRDDVARALDAGMESDFFWSQVRRRLNAAGVSASPRWVPTWSMAAATGVAVLVVSLVTMWQNDRALSEPRGTTEVGNIQTPLSNTSHMTFISGESGTTFIIISGLPTELEEEEEEL